MYVFFRSTFFQSPVIFVRLVSGRGFLCTFGVRVDLEYGEE